MRTDSPEAAGDFFPSRLFYYLASRDMFFTGLEGWMRELGKPEKRNLITIQKKEVTRPDTGERLRIPIVCDLKGNPVQPDPDMPAMLYPYYDPRATEPIVDMGLKGIASAGQLGIVDTVNGGLNETGLYPYILIRHGTDK